MFDTYRPATVLVAGTPVLTVLRGDHKWSLVESHLDAACESVGWRFANVWRTGETDFRATMYGPGTDYLTVDVAFAPLAPSGWVEVARG